MIDNRSYDPRFLENYRPNVDTYLDQAMRTGLHSLGGTAGQLPYLQPFEDVNKRVSRLAANIPFIKHNLVPLSFVDVPDRDYVDGLIAVYELNRIELARDGSSGPTSGRLSATPSCGMRSPSRTRSGFATASS